MIDFKLNLDRFVNGFSFIANQSGALLNKIFQDTGTSLDTPRQVIGNIVLSFCTTFYF